MILVTCFCLSVFLLAFLPNSVFVCFSPSLPFSVSSSCPSHGLLSVFVSIFVWAFVGCVSAPSFFLGPPSLFGSASPLALAEFLLTDPPMDCAWRTAAARCEFDFSRINLLGGLRQGLRRCTRPWYAGPSLRVGSLRWRRAYGVLCRINTIATFGDVTPSHRHNA